MIYYYFLFHRAVLNIELLTFVCACCFLPHLLTYLLICCQLESTAARVNEGATTVHGTPEGSTCCHLTLRNVPPTSTDIPDITTSNSMTSPAECGQRPQSARSNSRTPSQPPGDRPQTSSSPSTGNKRTGTKSSLPLSKTNDGRRPGSGRRTHQRSPGTPDDGRQRHAAVVGGMTAADDVAAVSSSSDAYSDDTTSSANGHTSTSPTPGQSRFEENCFFSENLIIYLWSPWTLIPGTLHPATNLPRKSCLNQT